ncbi:FAD-dependent monooxygenase [Streptomyces mayteni]
MAERRAVVVGGGIGGLAAAVALRRRGWRVEVLERAERFTEIGAGISLWPNALRALDRLGLASRLHALGAVERGGGMRDRAGRWLARTDNAAIERRYGWPLLVLHRADLLGALADALPADVLRPGCQVHEVRQDGAGVTVTHGAGTSRAELLVAADGLRSAVRTRWWPAAAPPRYAGHTAWRMVTDPLPAPLTEGAATWGRGERLGYTALPGGRVYCFAAATAPEGAREPGAGGEHAELRRRFGDWPAPIPTLLYFLGLGFVEPLHTAVTAVLFPMFLAATRRRPSGPRWTVWPEGRERERRRALVGQLLLILTGFGLFVGGATISLVGLTDVFVGSDLAFLHVTPEALEAANPRLPPFIAHDRAGFGGALMAAAVAITLLSAWGWRRGEPWVWWSLLLAAAAGFLPAVLVHGAIHYVDLRHLAPVYAGMAFTATGLALARPYLCARDLTVSACPTPDNV